MTMPLIRDKRELEGYLKIDHSNSPGFTPEEAAAGARTSVLPFVGPGKVFEAATLTCGHWPCGRIVIKNPDRVRARGYCPKCDHFVCDFCEAERVKTGVCIPFQKGMADYLEEVAKKEATSA
jgi:hypothetical protein